MYFWETLFVQLPNHRAEKDKKAKRQKTKRQKDKRQRPKREFNIVTSGQFRTLAMFSSSNSLLKVCSAKR